jgi:hypothetical protein
MLDLNEMTQMILELFDPDFRPPLDSACALVDIDQLWSNMCRIRCAPERRDNGSSYKGDQGIMRPLSLILIQMPFASNCGIRLAYK